MNSNGKLRDYIKVGDFVQAQALIGRDDIEEGVVYEDEEGTLRAGGLPVNATWVNILIWKKA